MRQIVVTILLVISWAGLCGAQETTGPVAEQIKKQILQIEQEKMQALTSTTREKNYAADWLGRIGTDDMVWAMPDGSSLTKAQAMAQFRTGKKVYSIKASDEHVRVYGNGGDETIAVITYQNMADSTGLGPDGKGSHFLNKLRALDVFVKINGQWRWAVHARTVAGIKDRETYLKEVAAEP